MKKFLVVASVVGAGALIPAAPAVASSCPSGDLVVNVYQTVLDDAAVGAAANVWASTSYARNIRVVKYKGQNYCAQLHFGGSFLSTSGISPGATGLIGAGVTGRAWGFSTSKTFSGKWRPTMPTSGTLPTVDFACGFSTSCPGYVDWRSYYFRETSGYELAAWAWAYDGGDLGKFVNRDSGTYGDIVG